MKPRLNTISGLSRLALLGICAGCAGYSAGTATLPRPQGVAEGAAPQAIVRSGGNRQLLYVADSFDNEANVYLQAGRNQVPLLSLPGQHPTAVAVDRTNNVYVASTDVHAISVFPPGSAVSNRTLLDTRAYPFGVAVGGDGTVYAANAFDFNHSPVRGDVAVYGPGKDTPSSLLTDSLYERVVSVGLDAHQNLYVGYDNFSVGDGVVIYPPHSTVGRNLNLSITSLQCLAVDAAGDIVISEGTLNDLKVFAAGSKVATRTISPLADPIALTFNHAGNHLYVDESPNNTSGRVRELDYATGKTLDIIAKPNAGGVCGLATTL